MKTTLLTGGGSGIGQEIAWALAKQNITVYIVGRRLEKLAQTAKFYSSLIHPIVADLTNENDVNKIATELKNIPLNFLIHNAGQEGLREAIPMLSRENWRNIQALNVEAPLFLTQALLKNLSAEARILLISSNLAHHGLANFSAYCASKAALNMLGKSFNLEFSDRKIYTGIIDPGPVDTDMQNRLRNMEKNNSNEFFFLDLHHSGSLANPGDVADYIVKKLLKTTNHEFVSQEWEYAENNLLFETSRI